MVALDTPGPFPFPQFLQPLAVDLEPAVDRVLFAVVRKDFSMASNIRRTASVAETTFLGVGIDCAGA